MKKVKLGTKIILPETNTVGIVTKVDFQGLPTQIKTKDGLVDVVGKVWDLFSLGWKLIRLIRLIFMK